jgi:hypothetical protein
MVDLAREFTRAVDITKKEHHSIDGWDVGTTAPEVPSFIGKDESSPRHLPAKGKPRFIEKREKIETPGDENDQDNIPTDESLGEVKPLKALDTEIEQRLSRLPGPLTTLSSGAGEVLPPLDERSRRWLNALYLVIFFGIIVSASGIAILKFVDGKDESRREYAAAEISSEKTGPGYIITQPAPRGEAPPSSPDPAILVAKISRAVASEQWKTAIETCQQLSGEAKLDASANCSMAKMEMSALELFEKVHSAALQNRLLEVIRHHNKIPQDSIYKKRDLHLVANAKIKFLAHAKKVLDDLIAENECSDARALASTIMEVDPSDTQSRLKAQRCGTDVAVKPQPPRPVPRPRPRPPKPQPRVIKPVVPSAHITSQAQAILKQAQDAYLSGNHRRSIQLAQQVLKLVPSHTRAMQILGSSACYLKNRRLAQWAAERLKPAPKALLEKICIRNGLNIQ